MVDEGVDESVVGVAGRMGITVPTGVPGVMLYKAGALEKEEEEEEDGLRGMML